ncbi:MAG: hypothetical protein HQ514_00770 [Rhodospirillales bacterium]|nr:hypothetical protein [Rhodospirillales bacterium]
MKPDQILLDPTAEISAVKRPKIDRPPSLDGLTIGLLDIAKPRGDEFLDRIEELLVERGNRVLRYRKERFSKIASDELKQEIGSACDIVVEALAD